MRLLTTDEQTKYMQKCQEVVDACADDIERLLNIQRHTTSVMRFIRSIDHKDPSLTILNKAYKRSVSEKAHM